MDSMLTYYVKLVPDDNDTVLVSCPALPEVASFGEDELEALSYAVGAIEEALAARMAHKQEIPLPEDAIPARLHPVRLSAQFGLKVLCYLASPAR